MCTNYTGTALNVNRSSLKQMTGIAENGCPSPIRTGTWTQWKAKSRKRKAMGFNDLCHTTRHRTSTANGRVLPRPRPLQDFARETFTRISVQFWIRHQCRSIPFRWLSLCISFATSEEVPFLVQSVVWAFFRSKEPPLHSSRVTHWSYIAERVTGVTHSHITPSTAQNPGGRRLQNTTGTPLFEEPNYGVMSSAQLPFVIGHTIGWGILTVSPTIAAH